MIQKLINRSFIILCILSTVVFFAYCTYSIYKVFAQSHNQSYAYKSLKRINEVQIDFKTKNGKYGSLQDLAEAGLMTSDFTSGPVNGYRYVIRVKDIGYEATATPIRSGVFATGHVSYFTNELRIIRGDRKGGGEATDEDILLPEP
jgi:hypothetical protein